MDSSSQDRGTARPAPVGQPVVAARTARLLVQLRVAALAGVLAVACSLMASRTLLRFADTSMLWPMAANVGAVVGAALAAFQLHVWQRAQLEWRGVRDVALVHLLAPSRLARWGSVGAALLCCLALLQVVAQTAAGEQAHRWAAAAAVFAILGCGLGGIHPLDPAGPPGVVPRRFPGARR